METVTLILAVLCWFFGGVQMVASVIAWSKHGNYDKAAYHMAFAAVLLLAASQ